MLAADRSEQSPLVRLHMDGHRMGARHCTRDPKGIRLLLGKEPRRCEFEY